MYHLSLNKINFYVEHKDSQYIFGMVQASLNLKFMWKISPQHQEGQKVNKYHGIQEGRALGGAVHHSPHWICDCRSQALKWPRWQYCPHPKFSTIHMEELSPF